MSADSINVLGDTPEVRVRFAPSPTGSLHIGGAKTALFDWLFAHGEAKRAGKEGVFILRIEDTDQKRLVAGATEAIFEILHWFGLEWQEGPDKGGPHGPYKQSERTALYQEHARQLVERGQAYPCFCSPERLQAVREAQQARGEAPGYDRHCRAISRDEAAGRVTAGEPHVVRFSMPRDGETRVYDLIRGEMVFQNVNLEDLVLLKSDGFPTYHLANVVDDHLMRITHIFRGEEWIATAPVHLQLYAAFGWEAPKLAHMPLIMAPGGGKLSKRHGSTAMEEFREQGYLPEALMNYLALLGWSFDASTEIFSKEELLEKFTLERVSPSPATFDASKLLWFNQYYINHILSVEDLTARVIPFLAKEGLVDEGAADPGHPQYTPVKDAVTLLKDRMRTLAEAPELMRYFLRDELDAYDPALLVPKKVEPALALQALEAIARTMEEIDVRDEAAVEERLRALAAELGLKAGQLFMPIRVAVTGRTESPGLFETLRVVGNDRVRARISQAIEQLKAYASVQTA